MPRELLDALAESPVSPADARRAAADGGVPAAPGIYAWWLASAQALPTVPRATHPTLPGLGLLYVGIAPKRPASGETLRSRILKKHLGTALAGSTFRRSLAALLWEPNGWTPRLTAAGRFKFSADDGAALRQWQERCLRVSWVRVEEPWTVEACVINSLAPPLNLDDNRDHPFYDDMSAARAHFKSRAESLAREPQ